MVYINHDISIIPFSFLCIWLYGFMLGLIKGNSPSFVLSNFAGILMYVLFYCLYSARVPTDKMIKLLLAISRIVLVLTIICYIDMYIVRTAFFVQIPILKDFQKAYTVEYGSRELIYISYLYSLYIILFLKQYKGCHWLIIVGAWIAELMCIKSGGDTLAMFVLSAVLVLLWAYKKWDRRVFAGMCLIGLGVVLVVLLAVPKTPFLVLFSPDDAGNAVRYKQIEVLLQEINFWGHGLGATFRGGIGHSYGVEMIYLNIFHKFGIFAIIMLLSYGYTVLVATSKIVKTNNDPNCVIPLACMGYLIPSLANPMLFAPPHVLAHCVALLLIYEGRRKRVNENLVDRNEVLQL